MSVPKILLIDYEPRSIARLREPMERAGYEVIVAQDGVAGMEEFHRLRPDLVLIEAMLPKKHGFEVCQALKQTALGKATPMVIITSVYKGRKYRTQALHQFGCNEYVEKPISDERLVETIKGLLDGSGVPSPTAPATPTGEPTGEEENDGNEILIIDDPLASPEVAVAPTPIAAPGQARGSAVAARPALRPRPAPPSRPTPRPSASRATVPAPSGARRIGILIAVGMGLLALLMFVAKLIG